MCWKDVGAAQFDDSVLIECVTHPFTKDTCEEGFLVPHEGHFFLNF